MKGTSGNHRPRRIKVVLILVILLGLAGIAAVFIGYRRLPDTAEEFVDLLPEEATVTLGKVEHVSSTEGREEWRLTAEAVRYMDERKRAVFDKISVVFFPKTENGRETPIRMEADRGVLEVASKNISVNGNVVMVSDDLRLKAEKLEYDHAGRQIISRSPVDIQAENFRMAAENLWFHLDTRKTRLKGNVEGSFDEDISL